MELTVINGSPRGKKSNSTRIVQSWMLPEGGFKMIYAKQIMKNEDIILSSAADAYLVIFPLYVDSVPAIVKGVFEIMAQHKAKFEVRKVWFVIHSGFPEPRHSRLAEKYVRYFAGLMGMVCLGTAVMGSSEGLQAAPDAFFGKKVRLFRQLGEDIRNERAFGLETVKAIAGRETLSGFGRLIVRRLNMGKFYWNGQLKKNGVFENRFDRPYMTIGEAGKD